MKPIDALIERLMSFFVTQYPFKVLRSVFYLWTPSTSLELIKGIKFLNHELVKLNLNVCLLVDFSLLRKIEKKNWLETAENWLSLLIKLQNANVDHNS